MPELIAPIIKKSKSTLNSGLKKRLALTVGRMSGSPSTSATLPTLTPASLSTMNNSPELMELLQSTANTLKYRRTSATKDNAKGTVSNEGVDKVAAMLSEGGASESKDVQAESRKQVAVNIPVTAASAFLAAGAPLMRIASSVSSPAPNIKQLLSNSLAAGASKSSSSMPIQTFFISSAGSSSATSNQIQQTTQTQDQAVPKSDKAIDKPNQSGLILLDSQYHDFVSNASFSPTQMGSNLALVKVSGTKVLSSKPAVLMASQSVSSTDVRNLAAQGM